MAIMKGLLIICDRCGATAFLKTTGNGENEFEPAPEGWAWYIETWRLCPCCNQEYTKLLESFMNKTKED